MVLDDAPPEPTYASAPTFEAAPPPPPSHPVNRPPEELDEETDDETLSVFQAPQGNQEAAGEDDNVQHLHVANDVGPDDDDIPLPRPSFMGDTYEGDPYDGLSTDDLEFIKSTVSSVANDDEEAFLYEPSGEIDDQTWLQDQVASLTPTDDEDEPLFSHDPDGATFRIEADDDEVDGPISSDDATVESGRSGAGWIVRPIIAPKQGTGGPSPFGNSARNDDESDPDDVTASPEEIEKIRRILNDLD
jgi:hypothetical protein